MTKGLLEEGNNYVVTGILSGRACDTKCQVNPGSEDRTSAYVNLRDPKIQTVLRGEISGLLIAPGKIMAFFTT